MPELNTKEVPVYWLECKGFLPNNKMTIEKFTLKADGKLPETVRYSNGVLLQLQKSVTGEFFYEEKEDGW